MIENDKAQLDSTTLKKRLEAGILAEILPYRQWVIWRYCLVNNQWKKPPFNPASGRAAKTTDRSTWGTFSQALYQLETGRYHGIGFVFSDEDPFTGTDLDKAVADDGSIAAWAQAYIDVLDSYTEYSPSRKGLHILTKATLSGSGRKAGKIEMYATTHYFTITADHLPGTPATINRRQAVQQQLYENLAASDTPGNAENTGGGVVGRVPFTRSDEEIIAKARGAKNGSVFRALWEGSTAGYASKSDADFALILLLLYWTDDDTERTDHLFRRSGLYDDKWNRSLGEFTYGQVTIYNALKKRSMRS